MSNSEHVEVDLRDIADQPAESPAPAEYAGKDEIIADLVEAAKLVIRESKIIAMTMRRRSIFDALEAAIARAEGR